MPYFTTSDGVRLRYEVQGSGKNAIAFLNGIAMNIDGWRMQADFLKGKGFLVLLHDMRGQGASDKPRAEYSLERHVLDLKELLDFLGFDEVSLAGISYGGKVSLMAALSMPDRIKNLVILNSSHTVDRALKLRVDRWILAARLKSGRFLWQAMVPDIFSDKFLNDNFSFVSSLAPGFELIDFVSFEEMAKAFTRVDLHGKLSVLNTQALVVAGTDDKFFPPRYSRLIVEELPMGKYYELDCGHVSIWEKPREVNELIYKFLSGDKK
ncbi:MAG: alpha/beta fold hydrolase [Infirmifilum uzonense]|uniref:alpha/beta fold hydrolase n=1 Tax=Infirmifilum uzonense TaxID=1550241 RepID=UPI003C75275D